VGLLRCVMGQVFTIFSTITGKGLKSDMQLYDRMITKQIIPFNATKFCGFKRDMFRPTCVIFMLNDVKKLKGCVFFRATAPPPSGPGAPRSLCFSITHNDAPQSV